MKQLWGQAVVKVLLFGASLGLGCTPDAEQSARQAQEHVEFLAPKIEEDVREVANALPQAEPLLADLWKDGQDPEREPEAALDGLNRVRHRVQDLRMVKSTLFALASPSGLVIRSDQEQDQLAGKNVFEAFPALRAAAQGKYVEARGAMHEARGVEGKPDGQWLAAQPINVGGQVKGVYLSGWAWSLYAYRLEAALKSHLADLDKRDKPLFYVFVVVDKQAFGTRVSPEVNSQALEKLELLSKTPSDGVYQTTLEITGRQFGLAVKRAPSLGADVAVAVLRSET